ncbi:MAG: polyprenol monophosphomannose synthase [Anaerolineae bacterium]
MRAAVIVPTYNEAGNIVEISERVLAQLGVTWLIIVDDASPDGTGYLADQLRDQHPTRVRVVHRAGKLGLGTAYRAGFTEAMALGADRVITMDADGSHDPAIIPAMLAASADADLVIGSRYVTGGGARDWGWHRQILSSWANGVAHLTAGLKAHDATSGFRCYTSELLQRVPLDAIRSDGYSYLVEILYHCQMAGAKIAELPILFQDRHQGMSKLSRTEILHAIGTVLRLAWQRRCNGAAQPTTYNDRQGVRRD